MKLKYRIYFYRKGIYFLLMDGRDFTYWKEQLMGSKDQCYWPEDGFYWENGIKKNLK